MAAIADDEMMNKHKWDELTNSIGDMEHEQIAGHIPEHIQTQSKTN